MSRNNYSIELRFPEFEQTGDWNTKPLGELADEISEKVGNRSFKLMSITSGIGLVSQIEKFGREIAGESVKNYLVLERNDFAYNKSSTKLFPEGEIAMLENEESGAVPNSIFTCFRFDEDVINPEFIKYPFLANIHGKWLKNFLSIGARANGALQVNQKDLFALPISYPSLPEQQKIADCLSSLDELITAHSAQLEALKAHKKGLLQQLFPAEGEKEPRLRFPEFQDSGEWDEKTIGEISSVTTGNKDTQNKVDSGLYPFFVRSQTVERINSFSYDGEAILTSGDGVGVGKNFHYIDGRFDFHQRVYCIYNFSKDIFGKFVYLYFSQHFYERVMKMTAKNSVDSVRMSMITDMPILIPCISEQQKVAFCLSSVEGQITAQTEKIALLKLHRKGLMQGLFPTLNSNENG